MTIPVCSEEEEEEENRRSWWSARAKTKEGGGRMHSSGEEEALTYCFSISRGAGALAIISLRICRFSVLGDLQTSIFHYVVRIPSNDESTQAQMKQ